MELIEKAVSEIEQVIVGKEHQLRFALCTLLSQGHLLIEDLPGMGKTTLSQALAKVLGLDYQRIQFTSDLLPADILGISIFDQKISSFLFHPGPVFSNIVLADEINRATPKTQSALLEAMEEGQITVEGETRPLPKPFFVIATQNPVSQGGTFSLPESQLDRFFMKISLGYPDARSERALLEGKSGRGHLSSIRQILSTEELDVLQTQVEAVHASDALLDYLQRLVTATRDPSRFVNGLSPRGALSLLRAAKAWALMEKRDFVIPEDIQAVFIPVCYHRLIGKQGMGGVTQLLDEVDVIGPQ